MAHTFLAVLAATVLGSSLSGGLEAECQDEDLTGLALIQAKAQARESLSSKKELLEYHWASGRGNFPNYGVANTTAPFDLQGKFSWQWHHPLGRSAVLLYGAAIDHQRSLYISAADGVRKFGHNGNLLWQYDSLPAEMIDAASLHDGKLYGSDTHGNVVAIDMMSGVEVWKTNIAERIGQDDGFTMAKDGVVVAACDLQLPAKWTGVEFKVNQKIKALNATSGKEMWTFQPDTALYNFLPLFVDEGDFVFQDMTGKVYRVDLHTGHLIWKNGGKEGTFTTGGAGVGNGKLFAVNSNALATHRNFSEFTPGTLSAYDLGSGKLLWKETTPRPPNNAPSVGNLRNLPGMSVVLPLCQQNMQGAHCDVQAYDADTGSMQWVFHGPQQMFPFQAADLYDVPGRDFRGERKMCAPTGWSAPSIDYAGTVFVGNQNGDFFALRDLNGDGIVWGSDEVQKYWTASAFSASSSPAIGPGILAVASCDQITVFKE